MIVECRRAEAAPFVQLLTRHWCGNVCTITCLILTLKCMDGLYMYW